MTDDDICPFCGSWSIRSCDLMEETGGECPWGLMKEDEPDPDILREDRDERRRLMDEDRDYGRGE